MRRLRLAFVFVAFSILYSGVVSGQQIFPTGFGMFRPDFGSPSLLVGYSPNASFVSLSATANTLNRGDGDDSAWGGGKLHWSTDGLWVGGRVPISCGQRLGVKGEIWALMPFNRNVAGRAGLFSTVDGESALSGTIKIDTTWVVVDLEAEYEVLGSGGLLAGVRYDYFEAVLKASDSLQQVAVNDFGQPLPKVDVTLNSVFPYVGISYKIGRPSPTLIVWAKGFPTALSVADARPENGYFAQIGIEATMRPTDPLSISVFARVDLSRAVFREFSDISNIFNLNPPVSQDVTFEQGLAVNRQQYIIGAMIELQFANNFWPEF